MDTPPATTCAYAAENDLPLPALLDSLAVAICGIDAAGRVICANAAARALFGNAHGALLGVDAHELLGTPAAAPLHRVAACPVCRALKDGLPSDIPGGMIDAAHAWLACNVRPLKEGTRIVGASLLFEDRSARAGLETELENSRHAAEAANLAKSMFLANMSHEIRTPMNAIVALSHLMLEDETDPKQLGRLHRVATSAQHLLALLNDILDLSKIEAGHLRLENIDFMLLDVLDMVRNQIEEKLHEKRIPFRLSIAPNVPGALHGDPLRLGQVLLNYASNAAKFTEQGNIILAVRRLPDTTNATIALRFEMIDTGVGFDAAAGERIFKPFEQADLSTTRQFGGTGLGLAICSRIAVLMGGKVGADSTPGKGSTFWLEAGFEPARHPAAARHADVSLKGHRLLLIGRRDAESQQIKTLAAQFGVSCYRTESGRQAVMRAKTAAGNGAPYDFLLFYGTAREANTLCDQDTLDRLRQDASGSARIFATHLHDSAEASGFAVRDRFDAILPLPLTASQLYNTLVEVLSKAADADGEVRPPGADARTAAAAQLAPYRQTHILLVEDNPINREVALDILSAAGLHADTAVDGAEAVEKSQTVDYDMILMDIQMPVMDGLVATRAIRGLPRHAETPIVAMTANAFDEDRRRCLAAGMDDYLAKPVTPTVLIDMLLRWLPHAPVRHPAPLTPTAGTAAAIPDFSAIPGLDAESGLVAVFGQPDRYARLLDKFSRHHAADVRALRAALAADDVTTALRIAHTLKGASAVLGAHELSSAAREVNDLIKSGTSDPAMFAALIDALEGKLDALVAHLAPFRKG